MAICQKLRIKKRRLCIGDLRSVIEFQVRSLKAPTLGSVDYDIPLTTLADAPTRAAIDTPNGVTIFDGAGVEQVISHIFYVRFTALVTTQNWILFNANLYQPLKVENMGEESKWLKIMTVFKGDSTRKSNLA